MDNKERLSFSDNYEVKDTFTPKGFVVIREPNGNIIFRGNNMVVKSGRKVLFDLFTTKSLFIENPVQNANEDEKFIDNPLLKRLINMRPFFGDNIEMVKANDSFDSAIYKVVNIEKHDEFIYDNGTTVYLRNAEGPNYSEATYNKDDFMMYYTKNGDTYTQLANNTDTLYYILDTERLVIHMGFNYTNAESPKNVSTFGLCYDDTLFSRIVFPKRVLTKNTPLIIDYYLYF